MAVRWLIQAAGSRLREPSYLHVLETDTGAGDRIAGDVLEFQPDATRAMRFASKHAAERFGFSRLMCAFVAVAVAAAALVETPDPEDDVDDGFGGAWEMAAP